MCLFSVVLQTCSLPRNVPAGALCLCLFWFADETCETGQDPPVKLAGELALYGGGKPNLRFGNLGFTVIFICFVFLEENGCRDVLYSFKLRVSSINKVFLSQK